MKRKKRKRKKNQEKIILVKQIQELIALVADPGCEPEGVRRSNEYE